MDIIQFPKDTGEFFICLNPQFPHPGLIVNKDSPYKFQPCCFTEKQIGKARMKEYYENISSTEDFGQSAYIIKTDKIIQPQTFGIFSDKTKNDENKITTCFKMAGPDTVYRYGIEYTPNSFLECVLTALNLNTSNLQRTRSRLLKSNRINASFLKQEMYNYSVDEIQSYIQSEEFLNPLLTVRLLERVYNCNILIFLRDKNHISGGITLPSHTMGYYQWKRDPSLPNIFIYMHDGSDSDNLSTHHCELIVPSKEIFIFTENNQISSFCWKVYDQLI
jgi:hypothetical protein